VNEQYKRIKNMEMKLSKKANKVDYDNSVTYGKPSLEFSEIKCAFVCGDVKGNNNVNKRTFRKLVSVGKVVNNLNKSGDRMLLVTQRKKCDNKERRCSNNVNNNYNCHRNSFDIIRSGEINDSYLSGEWKKWIDLRTKHNKENREYYNYNSQRNNIII
jgi:hypothetical protein